jgi:outer membrane protein, heavy metal efflux system
LPNRNAFKIKRLSFLSTFLLGFLLSAQQETSGNSGPLRAQFSDVVSSLQHHESVRALQGRRDALRHQGRAMSAWSDPSLSMGVQNVPVDSFSLDQSMMTSLSISLSQRVPLGGRLAKTQDSFFKQEEAQVYQIKNQEQVLLRELWLLAIEKKMLRDQEAILQRNLEWVERMISVSNELYATGRTPQQSILELQSRKSELEAALVQKDFEGRRVAAQLAYLYSPSGMEHLGLALVDLELESVPWEFLEINFMAENLSIEKDYVEKDYEEKSLISAAEGADLWVDARKRARVPDLTFSLSYMRRQAPQAEDMVSAGVSFPLPLGARTSAERDQAVAERAQAEANLGRYRRERAAQLKNLSFQVQTFQAELKILNDQSIPYSENSREITTRAYSLGSASYLDLINAEVRLQDLLMRRVSMEASFQRAQTQLAYLFAALSGELKHE